MRLNYLRPVLDDVTPIRDIHVLDDHLMDVPDWPAQDCSRRRVTDSYRCHVPSRA